MCIVWWVAWLVRKYQDWYSTLKKPKWMMLEWRKYIYIYITIYAYTTQGLTFMSRAIKGDCIRKSPLEWCEGISLWTCIRKDFKIVHWHRTACRVCRVSTVVVTKKGKAAGVCLFRSRKIPQGTHVTESGIFVSVDPKCVYKPHVCPTWSADPWRKGGVDSCKLFAP